MNYLLLHFYLGLIICINFIPFIVTASSSINPAFTAPSSGQRYGGVVVPWSEYRKKFEKEKQLTKFDEEDPQQPITLFLKPPFKNAFQRQSLNEKTELLETQRNSIGNERPPPSLPTNQITLSNNNNRGLPSSIKSPPTSRPAGFSYSTNTYRQLIAKNNTYSAISRPQAASSGPSITHHRHRDEFAGTMPHMPLTNGVPIVPTNNQLPASATAQFSRLAPASYSPFSPQTENIANSIFSQSQSQVRYAPQTLGGGSLGTIPQAPNFGSELFGGLPTGGNGNALGGLPTGGGNSIAENGLGGFNPLQFLSGAKDSPVEHFAKIARNLLSHENQELFGNLLGAAKPLTQSLTSGGGNHGFGKNIGAAELSSSALLSSSATAASAIEPPPATLIASSASKDTKEKEKAKDLEEEEEKKNLSESQLKKLKEHAKTEDELRLLKAAISNGELDPDSFSTLEPKITQTKAPPKLIKTEHRVLEWINQNRPPSSEKESANSKKAVSAQDLPYYGRYCGVFAEQINTSRNYEIGGALWAVDHRHFIVSKFHFKPQSNSDNITFWAGPKIATGNSARDAWPSKNGFYLKPIPIDIQTFSRKKAEVINATIRHFSPPINMPIAEAESDIVTTSRKKRDLFSRAYEKNIPINFNVNAHFGDRKPIKSESSSDADKISMIEEAKTTTALVSNSTTMTTVSDLSTTTTQTLSTTTTTTLSPSTTTMLAAFNQDGIPPLEWYAGFQPMLLTLPEDQLVKQTHWVSIYDHNRQAPVAVVLIPNGNAFQIPSAVQLRPFTPSGAYKLKSGPIYIKDTKTIEISEFSLKTEGVPVWFMIGKEVLPNPGGHIVPIFNKETNEFDCQSLRDYHNETITLRLPGALDIRDVFWFSIFSIVPKAMSLSHIFLPYNDMHLPPDLDGRATPICQWSSVH